MNLLIVCASRYGSSLTISEWMCERFALAGYNAQVFKAEDAPPPDNFDAVVLGSGIYGHKLMPELEKYIAQNIEQLQYKKTAVFGVAMRTETFFKQGHAYGGPVLLEKAGIMLGGKCLTGKILGGEIIYDKLNGEDKSKLEKFYDSIGLSDMQAKEKKAPRTMLNKKQTWDFAEEIISLIRPAQP